MVAIVLGMLRCAFADEGPAVSQPLAAKLPRLHWSADYHAGLDDAEGHKLQALLWFFDPAAESANGRFEEETFGQLVIREQITARYTPIKLAIDAKVSSAGEEIELLAHPAFAELHRSPGLAIVDMTEPEGALQRQVVSVYPFRRGAISAEKLAVLLDLPRGTLTQRSLIFAVRTHPELPASTSGQLSEILTRETENHARHQASITLQGHHNWNSRFHAINAQLPGGLAAREVCAESWPGQNLLEAAEECVHSWRESSGHWDAVRSRQVLFGYDMKRGNNGVWYAAGIFASSGP